MGGAYAGNGRYSPPKMGVVNQNVFILAWNSYYSQNCLRIEPQINVLDHKTRSIFYEAVH